jgi:hypothetical protein
MAIAIVLSLICGIGLMSLVFYSNAEEDTMTPRLNRNARAPIDDARLFLLSH